MTPKKHNPGCPCCDQSPAEPCVLCDSGTTRSNVAVTLGGVPSSGPCVATCSAFNDTFLLPQDSGSTCLWLIGDLNGECGEGARLAWELRAAVGTVGFNVVWTVTLEMYRFEGATLTGSTIVTWRWNSGGSGKIDCSAPRTLEHVSAIHSGTAPCGTSWSSSTCTVTP